MLVTSVEGIQRFQRGCEAVPRCWGNLHIHFTALGHSETALMLKKKEKYAINQNKTKEKKGRSGLQDTGSQRGGRCSTSVSGTKPKLCSYISPL